MDACENLTRSIGLRNLKIVNQRSEWSTNFCVSKSTDWYTVLWLSSFFPKIALRTLAMKNYLNEFRDRDQGIQVGIQIVFIQLHNSISVATYKGNSAWWWDIITNGLMESDSSFKIVLVRIRKQRVHDRIRIIWPFIFWWTNDLHSSHLVGPWTIVASALPTLRLQKRKLRIELNFIHIGSQHRWVGWVTWGSDWGLCEKKKMKEMEEQKLIQGEEKGEEELKRRKEHWWKNSERDEKAKCERRAERRRRLKRLRRECREKIEEREEEERNFPREQINSIGSLYLLLARSYRLDQMCHQCTQLRFAWSAPWDDQALQGAQLKKWKSIRTILQGYRIEKYNYLPIRRYWM